MQIYTKYWNQLVRFQELTVDRREAAGQSEARDHVTHHSA